MEPLEKGRGRKILDSKLKGERERERAGFRKKLKFLRQQVSDVIGLR